MRKKLDPTAGTLIRLMLSSSSASSSASSSLTSSNTYVAPSSFNSAAFPIRSFSPEVSISRLHELAKQEKTTLNKTTIDGRSPPPPPPPLQRKKKCIPQTSVSSPIIMLFMVTPRSLPTLLHGTPSALTLLFSVYQL